MLKMFISRVFLLKVFIVEENNIYIKIAIIKKNKTIV